MVMGFESKKGDTEYKGKVYGPIIDAKTGKPKPMEGRSLAAKQPDTLDWSAYQKDVYEPGRRGKYKRTDIISAVFGSRGLANLVNANELRLLSSEFDSIVDWVNKSPKPTGGTKQNLHGYIDGHLVTRDGYVNTVVAKKAEQTWSQYYASPEYRNGIGADDPWVLADV